MVHNQSPGKIILSTRIIPTSWPWPFCSLQRIISMVLLDWFCTKQIIGNVLILIFMVFDCYTFQWKRFIKLLCSTTGTHAIHAHILPQIMNQIDWIIWWLCQNIYCVTIQDLYWREKGRVNKKFSIIPVIHPGEKLKIFSLIEDCKIQILHCW